MEINKTNKILYLLREAAKTVLFFSGPATQRGGGKILENMKKLLFLCSKKLKLIIIKNVKYLWFFGVIV